MERRQFGTVLTRKRDDGTIQTWIDRYAYKGIRCQKAFGPDGRVSAEKWLEEEKLLIDLDRRGVMEWNPPQTRESQRKALELTFNEYADHYVKHHRRPDGGELTGGSKRNLQADVKHLRDAFGEKRLASITPSMIRDWYEGDHPEGPWAFKRECERLKAILTDASNPASTGIRQSSKRIRSSCQYRQIRKRNRAKSAHWTRTRYIACTRKCPNTRASACCWQRWLGHEDRGIVCPASRGHRLEKQNAQRQRQREPRNRGPGRITNRQNQKPSFSAHMPDSGPAHSRSPKTLGHAGHRQPHAHPGETWRGNRANHTRRPVQDREGTFKTRPTGHVPHIASHAHDAHADGGRNDA